MTSESAVVLGRVQLVVSGSGSAVQVIYDEEDHCVTMAQRQSMLMHSVLNAQHDVSLITSHDDEGLN